MSLPDVARAQSFNFSNPLTLNIAGPGLSDSQNVVVTVTPGTITTLTVGTPSTQNGQNWLCANNTSNLSTLTVSVGSGCGVGTGSLTANTNYNAQVPFTVNGTPQTLNVILRVGNTTTGVGLTASPNPLTFNVAVGSGFTSQNVTIFNSGALATVTNVTSTTTTGQNWLQPFISATAGIVTVNITPSILAAGSYTGTVFVTTTVGSMTFTVNVNVGTSGSGFGLAASPNPVAFSVAAGSGITSQSVSITFNGSPIGVTNATSTTNTGQGWLQPSISGFNSTVLVTVNPSFLTTGSDTGTVFVSTSQGQVNFQVSLTVGSGGTVGLVATPNPLVLNVPFGTGSTSQNLSITSNGFPVTVNSASASTANNVGWLQALNSGNTGVVTVTLNPSVLNSGSYTGSIFVSTTAGSLTVPVTLTVGGGTNFSGLGATPNPVSFNIPLVGSGAAPQTVNVSFNGAAATITGVSTSTVGQNWLIVTATGAPGALTLSINGANLTQGAYSGTVTINTTAGTLNLPVNLTVGSGGTTGLSATPNPVFLNSPVGGASTSQNVSITFNGAPASVNGVTFLTTTGQNWLQAINTGQSGTVTVTVTPSVLSVGTYTGTVTVSTTVGQVNFQVNLNVGSGGGGGTSGLNATPNPINLTAAAGGNVTSQSVSVTSNGVPATITGISSTTTAGGSWLQPFTSGAAGSVTVNANASSLQAGNYSGTVTVTTTVGTTSFQVNLTVGTATGTSGVIATPNPVSFTETAAGQAGSQTISVTLNGAPQVITNSTFLPLLIGFTFVNTAINPDGTVTLTVNGVATSPGFYQGTLNLFTSGGNVSVPVSLQFGNVGGGSGLAATPNPVTFNVQTGGGVPSQNVSVTFNGFPVTVTNVAATTTTGQNWLLPSLSGVTGGVNINVNALGLLPAVYSGTVTVTTVSGVVSLQVTLTVGGGGGGPPPGPTVIVTPVVLNSVNYQVGGASPLAQSVSVAMTGGGALNFTATGTTSSGGAWLSVSQSGGITPGTVTVAINAAALTTPGTFQGLVTITVPGATNSPVTLPISVTVTVPLVNTPTVVEVVNAASGVPTPLSPGQNIIIFGSNMGPATLTLGEPGSNGALGTTVAGTQVTFDGVPAAIVFTSDNQVSVLIPYAVANRAVTSLVVTYNGISSTAASFKIVDAAPGIYTAQSSAGQLGILNQDGSPNSAGNPEAIGNSIQIFATGEGQTTPAGSDGAITPNRLPTPTPLLPVGVTIGGVDLQASDISATEAPGLVSGILRVTAKIPAGVGTGPVSVVIRVGAVASQANVSVFVR